MNSRTRRVIIYTPLYMIFEFFLIKYLFLLFGGLNDIHILLIVIIFGILNLTPVFFEEKKSRLITRTLNKITVIWIWTSLFILFDLIIIYLLNTIITVPKILIYASLFVILIIGIYNFYKAHQLKVNKKTIELENITTNINIVHFSDVHFGSIRHGEILNKISKKLKELSNECDLAIISGDFADGSCVVKEDDFIELKEVEMPIIFTPGNHDFYPGIENVYKACKKAGIIILNNKSYEYKDLNIFGLTYSFENIETVSLDELKSFIKNDKENIIIYHVPQNWEEFSKLGFTLQLSGHTHGGQFYPVVWFGNILMYNMGLFKRKINNKNHYLNVTTGVGVMDYPMRWGTDSELVILKLKTKRT